MAENEGGMRMERITVEEIRQCFPDFTPPKCKYKYTEEQEVETNKFGSFQDIGFWLWFHPVYKDGSGTCMVGITSVKVRAYA